MVQWVNPLPFYNSSIFSSAQETCERIIHKLHRLPIAFVDRQGNWGDGQSCNHGHRTVVALVLSRIFAIFIGVLMILVSILAMLQIHLLADSLSLAVDATCC